MGPHKKPGIIYCDKIVSIRQSPINSQRKVIHTVDGSDVLVGKKMDEILTYLHPNYNV